MKALSGRNTGFLSFRIHYLEILILRDQIMHFSMVIILAQPDYFIQIPVFYYLIYSMYLGNQGVEKKKKNIRMLSGYSLVETGSSHNCFFS